MLNRKLISASLVLILLVLVFVLGCTDKGDSLKDAVEESLSKDNEEAIEESVEEEDYVDACGLIAEDMKECTAFTVQDEEVCNDPDFGKCVYDCYQLSTTCEDFKSCIRDYESDCKEYVQTSTGDDDADDDTTTTTTASPTTTTQEPTTTTTTVSTTTTTVEPTTTTTVEPTTTTVEPTTTTIQEPTTTTSTTSTTTTTMPPPSCESEQVNNGPLDEDNDSDGYSEAIGDCDDTNNAVNPGAEEVFDGVDNNCDGTIDEGFDEDCDGYQSEATGGDDCNDNDYLIKPGVTDDGLDFIDWNCDGLIGDTASGDTDADGFAALGTSGGVIDCDDLDANCFPGSAPLDDPAACMKDWDGDDYGDEQVDAPIIPGTDCDDNVADMFPGNLPLEDPVACMRDTDGDGYGDDQAEAPVIPGTDCDDNDFLIYPGAQELPDDGIDQDCNGGDIVRSDATGVFIATTGDDANPGTMAAPKRTINAGAVLASLTDKSVFVATGNYTEDVETEVSLFGAYESAGWTRNIDGYTTTINASTSTAVLIGGAETTAVQGFTINGGTEDSSTYGVYIDNCTVTLANNVINGGSGSSYSFGVYNHFGTATTLANNVINGGSGSDDSYGVYNGQGTATIVDNAINGGSGGSYSYGVYNYSGRTTLANNVINGGSESDYSFGVYNFGGSSRTTLANNVINGGSGSSSCGVYNSTSPFTATLVNNVINGGSGSSSCGVRNDGTMTLANNTIDGGSGASKSIGVYNSSGMATLANNVIDGGSGSDDSYGVFNLKPFGGGSSTATLANNVINGGSGNSSCGVFNGESTMTLANNTIDGGSGSNISRGVYNVKSTATLVNNDIWGADMDCMVWYHDSYSGTNECVANTIGDVNACTWTGCAEASGNISDDPLFDVDAYHLTASSPCKDTGIDPVPDYISAGFVDFDFDGDPRPYGAGWDIGADEWTP